MFPCTWLQTPLSVEILASWSLPKAPLHSLTVGQLVAAQGAQGRRVGLLLDLSNHDWCQWQRAASLGAGQAAKVVIAERRQVIKAGLRGLVEAARPDLSSAQIDAIVAEINKRMTMGSKQCCLTAVMCLSLLLSSFLGQPSPAQQQQHFPAAAPPAQQPPQPPPPVQLDIWDPQLLAQIKNAMELLTNASVIEHLMRGPHHRGIKLLPGHWESPLELCSYEGLMALPPIGKEYQQGYKRVNDRLPKVNQRLHRAAEYRRGIDDNKHQAVGFDEVPSGLWDKSVTGVGPMVQGRRRAQLQALFNSPRAGYLHCPSGLKAIARRAEAIAQQVRAENEMLMTEAQLQQACEEVLEAALLDLEEKHKHLQASHRQQRLDNESLEAVVKQQELMSWPISATK
ncbi:hypothetical protein QJQ45_001536 [Haematococcus lacustris]|nr:hypothetical protein QJQ45_001536 [Haematococcus lacustris]